MKDREQRYLELIRDNRGRLLRLARAYAAGEADRRDLYQEMLLQAWRSLPSFEGRSSPDTWLYRVALNTALDHGRSEEQRRGARIDGEHPLRDRGFERPDRQYEEREELEWLYAAIDRLDDADRALVLMYLEEKSYAEMAEVLEIGASLVVGGFFAYEAVSAETLLTRIGALIVVAAAVLVVSKLRAARADGEDELAGRPVAKRLEAEIEKVDAQIELLESVLWWYLAPIGLGLGIMVAAGGIEGWFEPAYLAGLVLFFGFVWWLNQRAVECTHRPRRKELVRTLRRLEEE